MEKKEKTKTSKGFKAFLKSRKARHGSLAIAIVIGVIAMVVVINIIVGLLVDRFPNLKADFTANNRGIFHPGGRVFCAGEEPAGKDDRGL